MVDTLQLARFYDRTLPPPTGLIFHEPKNWQNKNKKWTKNRKKRVYSGRFSASTIGISRDRYEILPRWPQRQKKSKKAKINRTYRQACRPLPSTCPRSAWAFCWKPPSSSSEKGQKQSNKKQKNKVQHTTATKMAIKNTKCIIWTYSFLSQILPDFCCVFTCMF